MLDCVCKHSSWKKIQSLLGVCGRVKSHHASISLKEKRILHESYHYNLGWSLPRDHYSPVVIHRFRQDFSLCFLKIPLECPVLLDWLSQNNHQNQLSTILLWERKMQIRSLHSVHDLVANSSVSIPNKINPSDQKGSLKFLSIHQVSNSVHALLRCGLWTHIIKQDTSFGSEDNPHHAHCLPKFGDILILYWGVSIPDFCYNRGDSLIPVLTSYTTNRRRE